VVPKPHALKRCAVTCTKARLARTQVEFLSFRSVPPYEEISDTRILGVDRMRDTVLKLL